MVGEATTKVLMKLIATLVWTKADQKHCVFLGKIEYGKSDIQDYNRFIKMAYSASLWPTQFPWSG